MDRGVGTRPRLWLCVCLVFLCGVRSVLDVAVVSTPLLLFMATFGISFFPVVLVRTDATSARTGALMSVEDGLRVYASTLQSTVGTR